MQRTFTILLIVAGCLGLAWSLPTSFTMTHEVQIARPLIAPRKKDADKPVAPPILPRRRPHLYLFTQAGCWPCVRLKAALMDPALREELARFDFEEVQPGAALWKQYKITATPTLIAVDADGKERKQAGVMTLGQLKAWLGAVQEIYGAITEGGPVGPGGVEVACDIPVELRHENVGGRDEAGCCPFASTQHSARYQNERRLWNFLEDVAKNERGGGWPEKMDLMMKKYGHGAPYMQYEGRDTSILELALKCGRMPAVTYSGRDCHYRGPIAHMVSLVYLSKEKDLACILDNNFIQAEQLVWMSYQEFMQRWTGGRAGWAVILLAPRPPAPPRN